MDHDARADAKLLNLPRETRDEIWELRHPVDEEAKALTYAEILVWLQGRKIPSSMGGLHAFLKAEKQLREIEEAREFSTRAEIELAKDPDMSPASARRWAQFIFTTKVAREQDLKGYVALEKALTARESVDLDRNKWEEMLADKRKKEDAESRIKNAQSDESLTPEQKRTAIVDAMDEFFGLKKKH